MSVPPPSGIDNPYHFDYWVNTKDVKMSLPVYWNIIMKLYDFNRLSMPSEWFLTHYNVVD